MIWVSSTDPVPHPIGARGCAAGCGGRAMACGVAGDSADAGDDAAAGGGTGAEGADVGTAGRRGAGAGDGTPPAARTSRQVSGACPDASGAVATGRDPATCGGRAIGVGVAAARAPPPPKTEDLIGCPSPSGAVPGAAGRASGRSGPEPKGHREAAPTASVPVVVGRSCPAPGRPSPCGSGGTRRPADGTMGTAPVSELGKYPSTAGWFGRGAVAACG